MKEYLGRICIVVALFAVPFLVAPPVSAYDDQDAGQRALEAERKAAEVRQKAADARQKEADAQQQKEDEIKKPLDSLRRKICEKRQATIKKSMTRVVDQRQKQIDHIGDIASRVQAFYVKRGHVLTNYDALVSDVVAQKTAAQAALAATQSDAKLECDSDGPKAQLQAFRNKRTAAIEAIKAYRQAVKNLIVGVKSVQPDKEVKS